MSLISNRLKILLGAEADDGWIDFMDAVHLDLPFLFKAGRPTSKEIEDSEIGAAGHKSWSSYIEKELKWKGSQWRAWMRAFKLVLEHPYLKSQGLTASAINTMNNKSDDFPSTAQKFNEIKADETRNVEKKRLESLAQTRRYLEAVTLERDALKSQVSAFNQSPWFKKMLFTFDLT